MKTDTDFPKLVCMIYVLATCKNKVLSRWKNSIDKVKAYQPGSNVPTPSSSSPPLYRVISAARDTGGMRGQHFLESSRWAIKAGRAGQDPSHLAWPHQPGQHRCSFLQPLKTQWLTLGLSIWFLHHLDQILLSMKNTDDTYWVWWHLIFEMTIFVYSILECSCTQSI